MAVAILKTNTIHRPLLSPNWRLVADGSGMDTKHIQVHDGLEMYFPFEHGDFFCNMEKLKHCVGQVFEPI